MNDVWLKVKFWTKCALFGAVLLYVVLFIYNNSGGHVEFWWWFNHSHQTSAFILGLTSFVAGAVFALLVVTTWRTMRQLSAAGANRRLDKIERDQSEIRTKAAMLHPHTVAVPAPAEGVTVHVDSLGGN